MALAAPPDRSDRPGRRRRVSVAVPHRRPRPRRRVALAARTPAGRQYAGERAPRQARRPIPSSRRTPTTWRRCSRRSIRREFHVDARRARASRAPRLRDRAGAEERADGVPLARASRPRGDRTVHRRRSGCRHRHRMPSIDAFNQAAEAYFTSLAGWEHHLAKPFSQIEETPALLMGVAVLLQALRLTPGMTVLEFGAGSGWLSRFLTQMGCRVVLLDVSPDGPAHRARALRAAAGARRASPRRSSSSSTDGGSISPTASVDRIVCFDAFHHAPNPRAVIREFARVLVDGGIAGFAEPGPRHAEAPRSQFESHTYGVVERDVDVHDALAHGAGVRLSRPEDVRVSRAAASTSRCRSTRTWWPAGRRRTRGSRPRASSCGTCGASRSIKAGAEPRRQPDAAGLACDIRATLATRRADRGDSRSWSTRSSRTPAPRPGWPRTRRAAASRSGRISTTRQARS